MTTIEHTPGPWQQDWHFIVAPDPDGIHPDIYIAEIAEEDSDGRVASPEQQEANGRLIVAAPAMLEALRLAQRALNTAPRFRVGDADSYKIAAMVDEAIEIATERRAP
jgi:hypothetical protein